MIRRLPIAAAGLALLAAVTLAGCGGTGAQDYPALMPLDGLLAEADGAFSQPAGQ